jgi:para-nitrobenzyl esterase
MHAADLCFMFGKHDQASGRAVIGSPRDQKDSVERNRLSESMMDALLAFARHGDPNSSSASSLPHWPCYGVRDRAVMSFNANCSSLNDPARARREWWTRTVYAPVMGEWEVSMPSRTLWRLFA